MYPEDRVLVGVMPEPRDLQIARCQYWYRMPARHAPKGIHADYLAFYFTSRFGPELRWAVHYYARRTGHELMRRIDLLPDQPDHPRAQDWYFKLQLGPLRQKDPPIVSLRWRRITFIETTWARFVAAREINDLFMGRVPAVERVYQQLKARGVQCECSAVVRERGVSYSIDLLVPCRNGAVMICAADPRPADALLLTGDQSQDMTAIDEAIQQRGGPGVIRRQLPAGHSEIT